MHHCFVSKVYCGFREKVMLVLLQQILEASTFQIFQQRGAKIRVMYRFLTSQPPGSFDNKNPNQNNNSKGLLFQHGNLRPSDLVLFCLHKACFRFLVEETQFSNFIVKQFFNWKVGYIWKVVNFLHAGVILHKILDEIFTGHSCTCKCCTCNFSTTISLLSKTVWAHH